MESFMQKMISLVKALKSDEDGAALVEYTVLLGIMLVAVVATIIWVGGWVNGHWTNLETALTGH
jgi:pilus assembly protein Flp/PilA